MKITPVIFLSTLALINAQENCNKKVVCYYTNWSSYRKGEFKFTPKDIDPFLCTHVIYSFTKFKDDMSGIKPSDPWQDISNKGYKEFTSLKKINPELKLLLALGGWAEGSKRFSELAASEEKSRSFAQGTVEFLHKNNFDGINIDWNFPGFGDGSNEEDFNNFPKLLKTMREVFDVEPNEKKLLLTIGVPSSTEYIDKGFDLPQLQMYADFITVICYNYRLSTDSLVNHHSPIYALPGEDEFNSNLNTDFTVKYILKKGVPNEKLVLGIAAFGRTFTLEDENMHGLGSPSAEEKAKGISTRDDGSIAFYEICNDVIKNGWDVVYVNETALGPYAHKGKDWVGYDDEKSAKRKGEYAKDNNLGGIMFSTIDDDDFLNKCGGEKYPLIKAAKEGLYSSGSIIVTEKPKKDKKVVCYYTNWSSYRKGEFKFKPKDIDPFLCTHLIYSFTKIKDDLSGIKSSDAWQDINNKGFKEFTSLKKMNPELKLLLALGGWGEGSKRFSNLAASEEKSHSFAQGTIEFLRVNNFDGINIDWNFPGFGDGSREEDFNNFPKLLKTMKEVFDAESNDNKLLLTMGVPSSTEYIDKGFDLAQLQIYVDFITIVCYNYHLSTDPSVNHHSPIYALPGEDEFNSNLNTDSTVKFVLEKGVQNEKLVLGIAAYGRTFTLEDENMHGLGSSSTGEKAKGISTRDDGSIPYYDICKDVIGQQGWDVVYVNETALGPYAHKGKDWVGFDDEKSAKRKGEYARDNNLGGVMFWAIDDDDFIKKCGGEKYPLIKAAKEGLYSESKIASEKPTKDIKVVCYYKSWSVYRKGEYRFTPKDIDPFLCTHIIYSFITFKDDLTGIKAYNPWQDVNNKGFKEFTALKNINPELKALAALGGWDEGSKRFSNIAASEEKRRYFAQRCVEFLRKENFDGIDIDWEFPGFREGSSTEDIDNFPKFLKTMREVFDAELNENKLLLSMAVPADTEHIDNGFDLPKLEMYVDFISILSYEYHHSTDLYVNHHSPMYFVPGEDELNMHLNMDWTVNYILSKGVPKEQLVLGIPAYGRTYTLEDENMHTFGSPSVDEGPKGTSTREYGSKAFYEICNDVIRNGWIVEPVNEAIGPYAHKGKEWVGYDDENSVKRKGAYARSRGLGGIMFWAMDDDDFLGKCGNGKNPLITAAKEGFYSGKSVNSIKKPKTTTSRTIITEKFTHKQEEMTNKPPVISVQKVTQGGNTYHQTISIVYGSPIIYST